MSPAAYITPESLRRNAIERLIEGHGAPWVRAALERSTLTLHHAVSRWSASDRDHAAHAVTLSLDAVSLARLSEDPVALDALERALGSATARCPGESIAHVALRWNGELPADAEGYRSAPNTHPATLTEALHAWIRATLGADASPWRAEHTAPHVTLRGPRPDPSTRAALERAALALSGASSLRWR